MKTGNKLGLRLTSTECRLIDFNTGPGLEAYVKSMSPRPECNYIRTVPEDVCLGLPWRTDGKLHDCLYDESGNTPSKPIPPEERKNWISGLRKHYWQGLSYREQNILKDYRRQVGERESRKQYKEWLAEIDRKWYETNKDLLENFEGNEWKVSAYLIKQGEVKKKKLNIRIEK